MPREVRYSARFCVRSLRGPEVAYRRWVTDDAELAAGDFSAWLTEIEGALRGEHGTDVPCGECTACCTASQFVHIGPEETDTLAHIPAELLFPAPWWPEGHLIMGYDEYGRCPM